MISVTLLLMTYGGAMAIPKAKKSFDVLLDKSNEAAMAIQQVADAQGIYPVSHRTMSRGDAVDELMKRIQSFAKSDLDEKVKTTRIIQTLHEINSIYVSFFDELCDQYPEVVDAFFDEEKLSREQTH